MSTASSTSGSGAPESRPASPAESWVAEMARLALEPAVARRLALDGSELRLARAWPHSPDHVLLELRDGSGRSVAGQWMRDAHQLELVRAETADRCPGLPLATLECRTGRVLLQPRGADRVLPALHRILLRSGTHLVAHRVEQRAVVRFGETGSDAARYLKIVAPDRVDQLAAPLLLLRRCDLQFRLPRLLEVHPDQGSVLLAPLDGSSLHDLLGDPARLIPAARKAGRALRSLHGVDLALLETDEQEAGAGCEVTLKAAPRRERRSRGPAGFPSRVHDPARVIRELHRRIDHLAILDSPTSNRIAAALPAVTAALGETSSPWVAIHRDFHDKQVLLQEDGAIGMLDFDMLSRGDAALDVSNLLAHFELRALQQLCAMATAHEAASAFLEGYAPDAGTTSRLQPYLDATRLRLACLYALRPTWGRIPDLLLARVGLTGDPRPGRGLRY